MVWRHYGLSVLAVVVATLIAVVLLPTILCWMLDASPSGEWLFWLQTAAGNWDPGRAPAHHPWLLSFSAVVAVLLNNSLAVIVLIFVWRTVRNWRIRMRLSQAFTARDQMHKQAMYEIFGDDPDTIERVKRAFKCGDKKWENELVHLFGKTDAARLKDLMPKEI
jgi:hypothetical protein